MKPFDTRIKGESLKIFAEEYNKFIKAAQIIADNQDLQSRPLEGLNTEKQIIFLKNDSDEDIDQYRAISMAGLVFQPQENETSFKYRFAFKGNKYDQSDSALDNPLLFCVTQQSIKAGSLGKAMINGSTQARINVNDESHRYVRMKDNDFVLETAATGQARIQFKEPGAGEKWAVIQMATSDCQRFRVTNSSGQTIPEGGAMQITGSDGPMSLTVGLPDKDNLLAILPLTGPDLAAGQRRWIDIHPVMRFKLNPQSVGLAAPGTLVGSTESQFTVDVRKFGFVVYAVETGTPGAPYVYCGFNGIVSLLTAVTDEDAGKIDVEHSDIQGVGDGETITLDVITEP